jgi:hypothetical protein
MRANNEQPSIKVTNYATTQAAKWVRANHPEVWEQFRARGRVLYGEGQRGARPKRADADA